MMHLLLLPEIFQFPHPGPRQLPFERNIRDPELLGVLL
jgi:hypothetical protein